MLNSNEAVIVLRKRAEAFRKAGLTDAAEGEEAKLAQLIGMLDPGWLIEDWLPMGHKGQITAPEGAFKTIWMSYVSVCIASGTPIFRCRVQQGPVLIVDEETPLGSLEKHLDRFSQGLGYSNHKELPIAKHSMTGFRFGRKTCLDKLLAEISQVQPRLITLDSFIAMLPGGRQGVVENDSGTGEIIRDDLNRILSAAPVCSPLLTAHSKKSVSELSIEELRLADMQSLVRGHGSIVGEGCDTGYVLKKLSQYPDPTRFAIITKTRRLAIPMSRNIVYVEMEEEAYGKGWARLKEISADVIPPSKYAKALYKLFSDGKPHSSKEIVREYALYTKGQLGLGVEELLNRKVILHTGKPQVYYLNPRRKSECNEEYLTILKNPDKGSL
jgi:hypothetical protein